MRTALAIMLIACCVSGATAETIEGVIPLGGPLSVSGDDQSLASKLGSPYVPTLIPLKDGRLLIAYSRATRLAGEVRLRATMMMTSLGGSWLISMA